jgi:hypothetical protein
MALVVRLPHADKAAKIIFVNMGKFPTKLFKDDKYTGREPAMTT